MIRVLIFVLTCFCLQTILNGQNAAIYLDSLSKIKESPGDSIIILELNHVASLARDENDNLTLVESLLYLGYYYFDAEDVINYDAVVTESMEVVRREQNVKAWMSSSVYNNFALLETTKGNYLKGNEFYLESINLEKNGENRNVELSTLYSNIAFNYSQLGDYQKSISFIERAISYHSESKSLKGKLELARLLSMAGKIYFDKGNLVTARKAYSKAQIILNALDSSNKINIMISNLQRIIELDLLNKNLTSAKNNFSKLKNISANHPYRLFRTYYLEGKYEESLGNTDSGLSKFDKALELLLKEKSYSEESSFLQHVYELKAESLYKSGEYKAALGIAHEGLTTLDESIKEDLLRNPSIDTYDNYPIAEKLLLLKARCALVLIENNEAKYKQIVNNAYLDLCRLFDVMKRAYLSEGSKYFVAEKAQPIYNEIIEYFSDQYINEKSEDVLDMLIYVMQANKSTVLFEAIKRKGDIMSSDIPTEEIHKDIELRNKKTYFQEILCKVELETPADSNKIKDLKSEIFGLEESLEIHNKNMAVTYPEYFSFKKRQVEVPLKEQIWEEMKDEDAIILFFEGKDDYYSIEFYKGEIYFEILAERIVEQVNQFQELVTKKPESKSDFKRTLALSDNLGSSLLQRIYSRGVENLFIISDGVFSQIPFDAFSLKGEYIINHINVSYFLSLQQYIDSKQKEKIGKSNMYCMVPDFATTSSTTNLLPEGLENLSFAKNEAEFLENLFNAEVKSDTATFTTDLINYAKDYSIIHLATHAVVYENDPMLSEIYFNDGTLTVFDIQSLNIKPEFVMLSACNTAVGMTQRGEGVISLSRGFFQAGVESIQSSLWPLDDYSSSEIVKGMYTYLKKGDEKSVALRKAKTDYLDKVDVLRSHPYYWAGIVQIGNNNALFPSSNLNLLLLLVLFIMIVFVFTFAKIGS